MAGVTGSPGLWAIFKLKSKSLNTGNHRTPKEKGYDQAWEGSFLSISCIYIPSNPCHGGSCAPTLY